MPAETMIARQPAVAAIDCRDDLSGPEFLSQYVRRRRPVLIRGLLQHWNALRVWSPEYLAKKSPDLLIPVKEFDDGRIKKSKWLLADYVEFLDQRAGDSEAPAQPLPYCHDIPLFHAIEELRADAWPFPLEFFPKYYHQDWWQYAQFFLGPKHSVTPLHFDCLLTNNLFFQIFGRKKFLLLDAADQVHCYRVGWRWFEVNPEKPDYARHPNFRRAQPIEVVVNPGEVLYMPPGMMHYVRGLDPSISFNLDWHTGSTALAGVCGLFRGMPPKNVYYNLWMFLGLACKVPRPIVFRFYKSYLNYVS